MSRRGSALLESSGSMVGLLTYSTYYLGMYASRKADGSQNEAQIDDVVLIKYYHTFVSD